MSEKYWFVVLILEWDHSSLEFQELLSPVNVISPVFKTFDECKKYRDDVLRQGTICETVYY